MMKRKDREITDTDRIFAIVSECMTAHLAMVDADGPYTVTMNYGYDRDGDSIILYFHCAQEGRKTDALKTDPRVFVQIEHDIGPTGDPSKACTCAWRYDSVTGSGTAEFLTSPEDKGHALKRLCEHIWHIDIEPDFPEEALNRTCVFRVRIDMPVGKHHDRDGTNLKSGRPMGCYKLG